MSEMSMGDRLCKEEIFFLILFLNLEKVLLFQQEVVISAVASIPIFWNLL